MRSDADGHSEKNYAALTSVIAALSLTGFKLVIGLLTNSLGILSEAAHSGFDLIAAIITLVAVRVSSKPADDQHLYGHGKVENLSALVETVLLLITCIWIIHEAISRLFFKVVHVEVTFWSFIVIVASIIIDFSRSRLLFRTARKYKSQALEADALHFQTDIWSSAVVLLGLVGVTISRYIPKLNIFEKLDAVAALGVAGIVIYISFELGKRTIHALLDTAPSGMQARIKKIVEKKPEVIDCHNIRIRASGPNLYIDVHVHMDGRHTLKRVHRLTDEIEESIHKIIPDADITIHPEPLDSTEPFNSTNNR